MFSVFVNVFWVQCILGAMYFGCTALLLIVLLWCFIAQKESNNLLLLLRDWIHYLPQDPCFSTSRPLLSVEDPPSLVSEYLLHLFFSTHVSELSLVLGVRTGMAALAAWALAVSSITLLRSKLNLQAEKVTRLVKTGFTNCAGWFF